LYANANPITNTDPTGMFSMSISEMFSAIGIQGILAKAAVVTLRLLPMMIDEIEVGDYVWAHHVETGETELKEVLQVFVKQSDESLHLETTVGDIDTATNHPFYVIGKGWVAAVDLTIGDEVYTIDGDSGFVIGVEVEKLAEPMVVYNLEVDGFHSYFVGENSILAHNQCTVVKKNGVKITSNYPDDHGKPVYLHVTGKCQTTKIGPQGLPVKGFPQLSPQQKKVVDENIVLIKKTIKEVQKWIRGT